MSNIAIQVAGLSKQYFVGGKREKYKTLRDSIAAAFQTSRLVNWLTRSSAEAQAAAGITAFWALNDVSFTVNRGEVIGIIGRNGAGKSTLLKVLARITEPTLGHAEIQGRIGSLLEVGTGFHNELTGRENVYLNGAILGMRREEIKRKFDEIVSFAEVEKFVDTPVKHYSTGMYLRLAFAVAAHLETEILLVDEVLAVGDAAFQRKCLGKMGDVAEQGRTVLLVSHDMTAISHLAPRCLWIEAGQVALFGETDQVVREYTRKQEGQETDISIRKDRSGDGIIRMNSVKFLDANERTVRSIGSGEPLTIEVHYSSQLAEVDPRDIWLDMTFKDLMGHPVATVSTRFSDVKVCDPPSSEMSLCCHIPSLLLTDDIYSLDLWLAYRRGLSDLVLRATELQVVPSNYYGTGHAPVRRKHGAGLLQQQWMAVAVPAEQRACHAHTSD